MNINENMVNELDNVTFLDKNTNNKETISSILDKNSLFKNSKIRRFRYKKNKY